MTYYQNPRFWCTTPSCTYVFNSRSQQHLVFPFLHIYSVLSLFWNVLLLCLFTCPCRRLLTATVGCRPPACCLLACCHWGHRFVPFILECTQLWATFFIILCVESAVAPTSACWQLILGRSPWSAPPSQILHVFHVIQTASCVYWYIHSLLPTQAVSN